MVSNPINRCSLPIVGLHGRDSILIKHDEKVADIAAVLRISLRVLDSVLRARTQAR